MSKSTPTQPLQFVRLPEPWNPHKYQLKAVKFLVEHAGAMLLQDPGLGKTSETLAAIRFLRDKGLVSKALVLAPKRVAQSTWPRELEKWEDFDSLRMVVLHGKEKESVLMDLPADVYVTNYDSLPWLLGVKKTKLKNGKVRSDVNLKRWRSLGFDLLVVDELTRFKDPSTQRFKMIKQVLSTFGRRWGLTGSPVPNGLLDLFGQCYVIDEGRALGRFSSHYKAKYFTPAWGSGRVMYEFTIKEGAEKEIYNRIRPMSLRMAAEDYIKMPKLIERDIIVDLPEEARRVYDELEDDLITRIGDRTVVAANAAVASGKCRQAANGGIYLDAETLGLSWAPKAGKGREHADLHDEKIEAVAELVAELQGAPLLVAYDFGHDLARLKERFGKDTPHIGGGVTAKKAREIEDAWNAGEIPLLLAHPQSVGHGLNLQGSGCHVAWHSITWNYELYDQFNRRVWRQGQKARTVFVHRIIAEDTIDRAILAALKAKEKGQRALFDALRSRALGRKKSSKL